MLTCRRSYEDIIARSWSFFWIKRIIVGRRFEKLPWHVRNAVMHHEHGHVEMHHVEKGLLCLLLTPWRFFKLCRQQEIEADAYAAKAGHAKGLLELLRFEKAATFSHPSNSERRQYLKQYE